MARARRPVVDVGGVPPEVASQLHPLWRDVDALAAHPIFGRYVDARIRERLAMSGRAYHPIVSRWAIAHGFESERFPQTVDWHALRAAMSDGVGKGPSIGVRESDGR